MRPKYLDFTLAVALLFLVVSGFARTWEQTSAPNNNLFIGMSADGRIICILSSGSHPVISADSGKTWTVSTNSPLLGTGILGVAAVVTADGSKIFCPYASQGVWVSADQGTTWTQLGFPSVAGSAYFVACSADGMKVIAATMSGPIYFSTNGGVNCCTSSVPNAAWAADASSPDGLRMIAAVDGGGVYFSTNFGLTWIQSPLPSAAWKAVCISADKNWIGATSDTGSFISSDAGATWLANSIAGRSISCSADGTKWLIAGAQIYSSDDRGVTWVTNTLCTTWCMWWGGLVSADGCDMTVLGTQGVWIGREVPSPQLKIQSQNSTVLMSWLLQSTNFVLQENSDAVTGNWVTLSNTATLNFTNLQQQVTLPAPDGNAFFRLIAQ